MPTLEDTAVVLEAAAMQLRASEAELEQLHRQALVNEKEIARLRQELAAPVQPVPAPAPAPAPAPVVPPPTPAPAPYTSRIFEGFGRIATGGTTPFTVTSLANSGVGTLRDALSVAGRVITFAVGGTIKLSSNLSVPTNTTIDGYSAPAPGISLTSATLIFSAVNAIAGGFRSRGVPVGEDAIRVYNGKKIVLSHISVSGFGDGAIDVTESSEDVTIQWSILGAGTPNHNFASLIGLGARRVTCHHNLYTNSDRRNPQVSATAPSPAGITADIRNNLIWDCKVGSLVRGGTRANVINNYYQGPANARDTILLDTGGQAYVHGNVSKSGFDLSNLGNVATPFAAVEPATTDALSAARAVLAQAGARGLNFGLDSVDLALIAKVTL